jgi:SAM-dependent MidA family methyltransferase
MDAGLRRTPPRVAPAMDPNPALADLIRQEIHPGRPITFARFMELALYAPEHGYYTSPGTRIGREGDFLTAPETHPIFGAALARQVLDAWRRFGEPDDFAIREYGAGPGALAESLVSALAIEAPGLARIVRYEAVEANPYRRADLERRLAAAAPGLRFTALDPDAARRSIPAAAGIVLANEFLDAFPVHRVLQTAEGLREVCVSWRDDAFAEVVVEPTTPLLAERLGAEGVRLASGQRAEIALGLDDWVAGVAGWLQTGVALVVDYGAHAADLYGPRHVAGTLLGYVDHQAVNDPLAAVGRQDLTAHVDFTAVERAAISAGLSVLGFTTQAHFLVALGLEELLERARSRTDQTLAEYMALRSGVVRLLDPRHTGGFTVLALGRNFPGAASLLGMRRSAG